MLLPRRGFLDVLALCVFLGSTAAIQSRYYYSAAYEDPIHLTLGGLLATGVVLFIYAKRYKGYDSFPYVKFENSSSTPDPQLPALTRLACLASTAWTWARGVRPPRAPSVLVISLVARSILSWRVIRYVQCSWDGASALLPLAVVLAELLPRQPFQLPRAASPDDPSPTWASRLRQAPYCLLRYLALAVVWARLAADTFGLLSRPAGAICPSGWRFGPLTVAAQLTVVFFDSLVLTSAAHIKNDHVHDPFHPPSGVLARAALASTYFVGLTSLLSSWSGASDNWLFRVDTLAGRDLLLDSALVSAAFISGVHLLSIVNTWTLAAAIAGVALHVRIWTTILSSPAEFHPGLVWTCAIAAPVSLSLLLKFDGDPPAPRVARDAHAPAPKLLSLFSWGLQGLLLMLLLAPGPLGVSPRATPQDGNRVIQELIASAQQAFTGWEVQARRSSTVQELTAEYNRRYGIPPPPNFDKWFDYAQSQDSAVVDAFDQLGRDLRPFWGLAPAAIRNRTSHLLEHHELHVGGLRIRDSSVTLSPHVPGTHRWMMEGYADMIKPFARWLPDMDIAFNLDDECRVAVPYEAMDGHLYAAEESMERLRQTDAKKRRAGWTPTKKLSPPWSDRYLEEGDASQHPGPSPFFSDYLRRPVFYSHVAPTCHPESPARSWHWWNRKMSCATCAAPHIARGGGQYVLDWELSGDLCHQPDLAYLHGFLLSPAPMIPTDTLFPVFSQGRVGGFSDILVPSPWNFAQKSEYDDDAAVPWADKTNALFWRGAPSDGFATHGSWTGFLRARFVKSALEAAARTRTKSTPPQDAPGVGVNVTFVGDLHKCDEGDCASEQVTFYDDAVAGLGLDGGAKKEFHAPPSAVPFAENWKYRHLIDLDGAGFSGRFIPFLQSHSLVYRAALFRTWFDERVHAWKHYVPVDLRLGAGLWELLGFFGRDDGAGRGAGLAEQIGADGRRWAERVLRPQDMQVYMFRLLLEWGRLVDDERENLGFYVS